MRRGGTAVVVAIVAAWVGTASAQQVDDYAHARTLAFEGQRAEAIAMLRRLQTASPDDGDVLRLLGTVLSWDGQYDEARTVLERALTLHPHDLDTLSALMNVELWSNHPRRSLELAHRGVAQAPNDNRFLLARDRAQHAIDRDRPWAVSFWDYYDQFSDGRDAWHEQALMLKRETPVGAVIARASRATRFDHTGELFEAEMYPRFGSGTYAYVSVGFSPDHGFYPEYRFAGEFYQSLGQGFEASLGYQRLEFDPATDIYTGSLTKYVGNWILTGRVMIVPSDSGTSESYHAVA
jgi:tetratricopeptide (TPR) repeat protein